MYCSVSCKQKYRYKRETATEELKEERKKSSKEYYKKNRIKHLKEKKEYYKKNRKDIIKKNSDYKKNNPETDKKYSRSLKGRYRDYKKGAVKRGLEFSLTLDDFEKMWDSYCYYCKDKIDGIGIDRVDNNIGYIKENIVSCCPTCNVMKLTLRQKDFISNCIKISKNFTI